MQSSDTIMTDALEFIH